jgi:CspA family cold shock protein
MASCRSSAFSEYPKRCVCCVESITDTQKECTIIPTGAVKFFYQEKGYGFIICDDGGPDVFVQQSTVTWAGRDRLNERECVSFDIKTNERMGKIAASNLRLFEGGMSEEPILSAADQDQAAMMSEVFKKARISSESLNEIASNETAPDSTRFGTAIELCRRENSETK